MDWVSFTIGAVVSAGMVLIIGGIYAFDKFLSLIYGNERMRRQA